MSIKAKNIPDDAIEQVYGGQHAIWYRVGVNPFVSVTATKDSTNVWRFTCLTCRSTDSCAHTQAVRRYCGHPLAKAAA